MAYLLLLETATEICSVGICKDGKMISTQQAKKNYQHSERLTILIEKLLKENDLQMQDLSAITISKGPGSYTALRIGTSTAKGICYALDLPLIAIDTLTALADAAHKKVRDDNTYYCPMIDARRMEVYASLFDAQLNNIQPMQSMIIDESSFRAYFEKKQRIVFVGNGAPKCKAILTNPLAHFEDLVCDASHLAALAHQKYETQTFEDVAYFVPTYGKAPNITTPKKIVL
ncbi:MAG: tRNA (adenosine(37)-N6)-threonylcarbamoyltransferase complex dimerization subunit type 1 TsaB [Bacteroidota bacterium]